MYFEVVFYHRINFYWEFFTEQAEHNFKWLQVELICGLYIQPYKDIRQFISEKAYFCVKAGSLNIYFVMQAWI